MIIKVPKVITLQKFANWIREYTRCEIRATGRRLNIVVFADNIEPGCCVSLYAETRGEQVVICELTEIFNSPDGAWQALNSASASTYPPTPFHQWVTDQYLTAPQVKIKQLGL